MTIEVLHGHVIDLARQLAPGSIHCIVTSPPYWGLRNYHTEPQVWGGGADCKHVWGPPMSLHKGGPHGSFSSLSGGNRKVTEAQSAVKDMDCGESCEICFAWRGELGREPHPDLYVEHLVDVFRASRDALRDDGIIWLNLGDTFATGAPGSGWRAAVDDTSRHTKGAMAALADTAQVRDERLIAEAVAP
ncbi:MAG TPA: hypothetical protein VMT89_00530, partial [Candidatus Acidoferrales bacterium]|nr:hypothetical protein [Candidatus Acidoferrales bacterium]